MPKQATTLTPRRCYRPLILTNVNLPTGNKFPPKAVWNGSPYKRRSGHHNKHAAYEERVAWASTQGKALSRQK